MKCRIALAFLFAVLLPSFPGIPKTGISFAQEASPATLKIAGGIYSTCAHLGRLEENATKDDVGAESSRKQD
jgi:hypothetical protein